MSAPTRPVGADAARSKLTQLQSDEQLASRAPVAIEEAEVAVRAAEVPQKDATRGAHLVQMADRKIDIAREQAQTRLSEDQRKTLSEQRERARLDSRTREADNARGDAVAARADADIARSQAEASRLDSEAARMQAETLQIQIAELNAKATDRGLVVTLGDVLFETGRSELKGGATSNLAGLARFLNEYPDRTVLIEGHTDNVGSDDSNFRLSQQRADSVKAYLAGQGIVPARLDASGKGEGYPVSGNESATGRQQNRRVEVVISNTVTSLR
jgi:outer membrane protein OmpA-like peptidoglycan-associated protein